MTKYEQAEVFGIENRIIKLSEECAELIQALTKYYEALYFDNRKKSPYIDQIAEELADVYLLSAEVRHLLDIHADDLETRINYKLKRTDKIIEQVLEERERREDE